MKLFFTTTILALTSGAAAPYGSSDLSSKGFLRGDLDHTTFERMLLDQDQPGTECDLGSARQCTKGFSCQVQEEYPNTPGKTDSQCREKGNRPCCKPSGRKLSFERMLLAEDQPGTTCDRSSARQCTSGYSCQDQEANDSQCKEKGSKSCCKPSGRKLSFERMLLK